MSEPEEGGSFETFYRLHFERVARGVLAFVRSREEARDIAHEAFVPTWEKWDRLSQRDEPLFFTLRVAINLAKSRLRRVLRYRQVVSRLAPGPTPPEPFEHLASWAELQRLLRDVPPQQKAAVVLRDVLDQPTDVAARILGISPSTLRVHLARGRNKIRAAARSHGERAEQSVMEPATMTQEVTEV